MKAKRNFYAMGQRAKAHGINKHRAIKHYHIEGAPKWAKQAFIAGWEDAATEREITYRFEELSERAKDRVRTWLAPDHDWWYSVYEMAVQDAAGYGIKIDTVTRSGRLSDYQEPCLWFDSRYGYDVTFNADINIEAACKDFEHQQHVIAQYLLAEGAIEHVAEVKNGKVGDLGLEYHDFELEHGPMAGASIEALHDALSESYYDALASHLQSKCDAFASHVADMLDEEYDYLSSDDYIAETCECNDYLFDEDGFQI